MVPKMGPNGSIWLLLGLNSLWCPKLVGKGWNKIGTGYGALGLTTLTTLPIHKYPNLDPRGPKWVQMGLYGYYWVLIVSGAQNWLEKGGTRLEQGIGNWNFINP